MKKKADSLFNNLVSKGKKMVNNKPQPTQDFDFDQEDDLVIVNHRPKNE